MGQCRNIYFMQSLTAHMHEDCPPDATRCPHALQAQHNGNLFLAHTKAQHQFSWLVSLLGSFTPCIFWVYLVQAPSDLSIQPVDGEGWILVFPGSDPEVVNITVHTFHCPQLGLWVAPNCKGSWEMWVFVCLGDKGKWEQSIRLSQLSASESRNDENEVVAIGHFVEGKESSLDLWGLRTSPGNHHVDVCKCVYIC